MKLKGIELKGTYKVVFDDRWVEVYDERDHRIYFEDNYGYWAKSEYDERGNQIYYENSDGYWAKSEYDERGNQIYYENSDGYWAKSEYDERRNEVYFEDNYGHIVDNREKELTIKEIEKFLGYKIKIKGEKK